MMPTFPRSSLSFRTAGFTAGRLTFPRGAFPDHQRLKPAPGIRRPNIRFASALRAPRSNNGCPALCRAEDSIARPRNNAPWVPIRKLPAEFGAPSDRPAERRPRRCKYRTSSDLQDSQVSRAPNGHRGIRVRRALNAVLKRTFRQTRAVSWILEPSPTRLCEPDLHVFAKLFEDRLERGLEAQAFSRREIGGDDDVLDFFVGHLVDVDLTRQPAFSTPP
jgi:hypothetical protein